MLSLHDDNSGFLVHGHIDDLESDLRRRRVLLAPLRFGAGIKGKIVDAWQNGCPVISTPIGAEGMIDNNAAMPDEWGGKIASNPEEFVQAALNMYTQSAVWEQCQESGTSLLNKLFNKEHNLKLVESAVRNSIAELEERRASDLVGAMLWHQGNRSTKYFSKWIELKESIE